MNDPSLGQQVFGALRVLANRLVVPSLVPIYIKPPGKQLEQYGTGFLINYRDRPLLVTAKHCLFKDSPAFEKLIFFNGAPRPLGELHTGEIISDPNNDLAILYVDELGLDRCLPTSCLVPGETTCGVISTVGFLGRDFERDLAKGLFPVAIALPLQAGAKKARTRLCRYPLPQEQKQRRDNRRTCAISDTEGCVGRPYARHCEA
jgi:hypothetical protein